MKNFYIPLFSLFFILPFFSICQEYSYTNYNSKEGLAGSTVYCILQDKEGFLWIGTETGLSRFDGTHFKNFTTADGLPDNEILKLFVDSKNRVWIIPFKNAVCYYWKGKIYNKDNDSLLKKIHITSDVLTILEDRYGNILIQEESTSNIIKANGGIHIIKKIEHQEFQMRNVGINEEGTFRLAVIMNKTGLAYFDLDNGKTQILKKTNSPHTKNISDWYLISPQLEVVRKTDSLLFFAVGQNEIFSLPLPENFINISLLNDSLFVINAATKCMIYNLNKKRITKEFLPGHKVTAVLEDREKNLWFTTLGEGIFRLGSTEFRNLRFKNNESSLSVFGIQKSGSSVYIGTDHSLLWTFNRTTGSIGKNAIGVGPHNARILSIVSGSKKNLMIGTDRGLYKLQDSIKYLFSVFTSVKAMVFYGDKFLVASSRGAHIVPENAGKNSDVIEIWAKRATCAFPHDSGFYIGTLNGLYDVNEKREAVFLGGRTRLLSNRISVIAKSGDGIFWIGTYGEGIIGYKDGKVITHLIAENGLSSNICRNIFVSGNILWVGTDKGLNKITMGEGHYKITKFTTADGLSSDIINAVYVDDGIVYVGTPQGVTYFDENKISQNSDCVLRITAIKSSDRVWNFDTTAFLLPHKNNNIRFEFVALSYKSAGHIVYKYRLMGLDSKWKMTNETFLSYPALPSGKYELQLIAINKFGVQSDRKSIGFAIEELLEEKTWFRLLVLLIAGGGIWIIVNLYIKGIRKKEAGKANTLRKMAELEQKALRAQMNPHFIYNSLNSIQQYVMDKDITGANKFITGFSSLMRQTLDFSSRQEISLEEELKYLSTYLELEKTRMEDKFVYEIQLSDKMRTNEYYIPPMILQPFVENSIRHGIGYRQDKHGKILISITRQPDRFVCTIEDNGVGRLVAGQFKRNESIHRQSKGMSLTEDRIDMFNKNSKHKIKMDIQDMKDEHDNALGTRVIISFPL